MRRALARLEEEGRIIRRRGSGTFARQSRKAPRIHLDLHAFYDDVPELASQTTTTILKFEVGTVPTSLRELQPAVGSTRVDHPAHTPLSRYSVRADDSLYSGEPRPENPKESARENLASGGAGPNWARAPRKPNTRPARSLPTPWPHAGWMLALGLPLLRTRAVLSDSHRQLHAVIESLCRPDRFSVRASLERQRTSHSQWRLKR